MKTMISEFQPNPIGADPMDATFELSGVAGASFFGTIIRAPLFLIDFATLK
jgi:hypothetical protein